ncbi:hypothetical protein BKA67DRAFT_518494 [Truncatella angustata]|uniref:Plasma membrane proteolipid 3 n=1 Tax=Truncatella angustata TaxID=152316 RepID=A0A9P8ZXM6_9PEZI|nr:uncharacterized protein BKA67DRAFT_518494 [Truncatella angustata]KAH6653134.1 hypothetical protein BKA67DRAFT_518494 [Truncatella angustata]
MPFTARLVRLIAKERVSSFLIQYLTSVASDPCKIILAIIMPPLGVFAESGCGTDLCFNILLTCLGFLPGIVHALYIIKKY